MKWITASLAILTATFWIVFSPPIAFPQEKPTTLEVYFSPNGGCTDAVIRELSKAKSTVLIQAHSAKTHLPIHKPGDLFKKNFQINIWKRFNLKTEGHDG